MIRESCDVCDRDIPCNTGFTVYSDELTQSLGGMMPVYNFRCCRGCMENLIVRLQVSELGKTEKKNSVN